MNRRSFFSIVAAVAAVPKVLLGLCKRPRPDSFANYPTRYRELSKQELLTFAPKDAEDWPEWLSFLYTDQKAPGHYVVEWPRGYVIWIKRRTVWDPTFRAEHMTFESLCAEAGRRAKLIGF
ncbi:hypothetical protein LCGC14_0589640 [marine sediment metagenome]|uniref:Uncharacterized protein n=1 Tax=marine sediment metagenome TaxID=412755 RepID=A0A0F9RDT3_9ZZZZ